MKITYFRKQESGCLKGFFNVELSNGMEVKECVLFEKDGSRWINLPNRRFVGKDGEEKTFNICYIADKDTRDKFSKQCVELLASHVDSAPEKKEYEQDVPF